MENTDNIDDESFEMDLEQKDDNSDDQEEQIDFNNVT